MASEPVRLDLGWLFRYQMYLTRVSGVGREEPVDPIIQSEKGAFRIQTALWLGAAISSYLVALQQVRTLSTRSGRSRTDSPTPAALNSHLPEVYEPPDPAKNAEQTWE